VTVWLEGAVVARSVPIESGQEFGDFVRIDELPEVLKREEPVYPVEARRAGVSGTVMVQALVATDGSVLDTRVVRSVRGLDEAAERCVRRWRFKPAMRDGQPVECWIAVPVRFSLH
jgi:protein TonB